MADAEVDGVPPLLAAGVPMLKVSSKKIKPVTVRLSDSAITWPSLKGGRGTSAKWPAQLLLHDERLTGS